MLTDIFCVILLPFIGTATGSACVYFMRSELNGCVRAYLTAFACGVMTAASVWSLLVPAIERCERLGTLAFLPAFAGFWSGVIFLIAVDRALPRLFRAKRFSQKADKTNMLVFAVALHNLPEGMAVGAVCSALLSGGESTSLSGALALSLGIAVQNFPEGAIVSMPLRAHGMKKSKAFAVGVLSGLVEPAGALLTVMLSVLVVPLLPVFLSFAAGAMVYVVIGELLPDLYGEKSCDAVAVFFSAGFSVMMALDVALG